MPDSPTPEARIDQLEELIKQLQKNVQVLSHTVYTQSHTVKTINDTCVTFLEILEAMKPQPPLSLWTRLRCWFRLLP